MLKSKNVFIKNSNYFQLKTNYFHVRFYPKNHFFFTFAMMFTFNLILRNLLIINILINITYTIYLTFLRYNIYYVYVRLYPYLSCFCCTILILQQHMYCFLRKCLYVCFHIKRAYDNIGITKIKEVRARIHHLSRIKTDWYKY